MKKLKLLLIPLISLLFVVNVNATELYVGYDNEYNVNDTIETYKVLYDRILEYLITSDRATSSDIFVSDILWNAPDPNGMGVCKLDPYSNITLTSGSSSVYFSNCYIFTYDTQTLQPTYVRSNWVAGINIGSVEQIGWYYWLGGDNSTTQTITNNSGYDLVLNNQSSPFLNNTSLTTNNFVSNLNYVNVVNYCYPNNFLGQLENVSAFSVVVKGKTNALNHNLTGTFDIISNKNIAVNEWDTQFNANVQVTGRHQMNCINNRCEINFDYNIEDDIYEDITLVFTYNTIQNVSMPTRIQFNSCSNYDNISEIYYTYINDTTNVTNNNDTGLQNNINDTNINGANGYLNDLLNNEAFTQDNGLLAIIQAPINFINSLSSKTCQSFNITIPFINATATIPCMSTIYNNYLGTLFEIIRVVINGILCYRIALSIVLQVKDARNPNSDKIEVMDL